MRHKVSWCVRVCVCVFAGGRGKEVTEYTGWTDESLFLFHPSINNSINQSHNQENRTQSVSVTSGCIFPLRFPRQPGSCVKMLASEERVEVSARQRVSRTALRSELKHLFEHGDFNNLSRLLPHSSIADVLALSTLQCLIQQSPSVVPAC